MCGVLAPRGSAQLWPRLPGQAGQAPRGVYTPVPAVGLPSTPSHLTPAPARLPFLQGGPRAMAIMSNRLMGTQPPLGRKPLCPRVPQTVMDHLPQQLWGTLSRPNEMMGAGRWPGWRGESSPLWGSLGPRSATSCLFRAGAEACHHPWGLGGPVGSLHSWATSSCAQEDVGHDTHSPRPRGQHPLSTPGRGRQGREGGGPSSC